VNAPSSTSSQQSNMTNVTGPSDPLSHTRSGELGVGFGDGVSNGGGGLVLASPSLLVHPTVVKLPDPSPLSLGGGAARSVTGPAYARCRCQHVHDECHQYQYGIDSA
jgi:hypothetical protein